MDRCVWIKRDDDYDDDDDLQWTYEQSQPLNRPSTVHSRPMPLNRAL